MEPFTQRTAGVVINRCTRPEAGEEGASHTPIVRVEAVGSVATAHAVGRAIIFNIDRQVLDGHRVLGLIR